MDPRYASLLCPCMSKKIADNNEGSPVIELDIPNYGRLELEHLVLDYNGTIARDGELMPGVADRLRALADLIKVTVLTADTHGTVRDKLAELPVTVAVLAADATPPLPEDQAKRDHLHQLGPQRCVFMGNGRNDHLALRVAALGVALVQAEGASPLSLMAADVVAPGIDAALDLLLHPSRLVATLRT